MKNMYQLWILFIICGPISTVLSKYSCFMKNKKIDCHYMKQKDLRENLEVIISSADVVDLTVSDSIVPLVDRAMLGKYQHLHTLRLQVQAENIEEDAFSELFSLRNLYLNDNWLHNFSFGVFASDNVLYQLDLSNNLLQDLTDFNASSFPLMTILNISNNRLEYLPVSLVKKLEGNNNFYLIIDSNPWDCTHPKWIDIMNPTLVQTFCLENRYNASVVQKEKFLKMRNGSEDTEADEVSAKSCKYVTRCFSYCIFWFVGAIWIGIILGNVCKLKGLFCVSNLRHHDKNTQYDKLDLRPKN